jgi:hypothetical protein
MPDHISIAHSSPGIRSSSALDVPIHRDVCLLAQCRGRLSRHADKAPTKARFVPLSAEPPTQRPMTLPSSTFRNPWPPDTVNTLSPRPYPRPRKLLCQQCQVVLECLKGATAFDPTQPSGVRVPTSASETSAKLIVWPQRAQSSRSLPNPEWLARRPKTPAVALGGPGAGIDRQSLMSRGCSSSA